MINQQIKDQIIRRIYSDTRIHPQEITVEVSEGHVVLTGSVQSISAREAAESNTWAVPDVKIVDNRLRVRFPQDYIRPSDDSIVLSLIGLLSVDPDLYLEKINCSVIDGNIIIQGTVDKLYKKIRAGEIAKNAGGVLNVENKIIVVPQINSADQEIGQSITDKFFRNASADVKNISVKVENGHVTLIGTVPNRASFDFVEDMARYTDGVVDVHNQAIIREA
jgi:osmotically-inducible protein OsmY